MAAFVVVVLDITDGSSWWCFDVLLGLIKVLHSKRKQNDST